MITWMQRHRKYLIITLWISGGAFIAAGPMFAIGSGSFSGRGADSVAKVGDIEISVHQMNTSYRQLFAQYNQMFQGKFDEAQAKAFGLEQQALRQLINEALLLNLAEKLKLVVTDKELSSNIAATDAFYKDGKFDKETYQKVLKQAQLNISQYESDVRRSLLLNKMMDIFSPKALPLENEAVSMALYINDKISYQVLDASMIKVSTSEEELKSYWEAHKFEYMSEPSFQVEVVEQTPVTKSYSEDELKEAYESSKHEFVNEEGMIKSFEEAKPDVISALDTEATNKEALRTYISYKKESLDPSVTTQAFSISESSNPFGPDVLEKISKLSLEKPYLKPQEIEGKFLIFKLIESKGSEPKSFEEAKIQAKAALSAEQTTQRLRTLAKNSLATFSGKTSAFLTRESIAKLPPLAEYEAAEFLEALFAQQDKRGFIELKGNKIVLFNILEQKLLAKENKTQEKNVLRLKTSLLNDGLLKKLEAQYPVTSYLKGN
jgi:peptidyl-prolyl cis-trans isomerase D